MRACSLTLNPKSFTLVVQRFASCLSVCRESAGHGEDNLHLDMVRLEHHVGGGGGVISEISSDLFRRG